MECPQHAVGEHHYEEPAPSHSRSIGPQGEMVQSPADNSKDKGFTSAQPDEEYVLEDILDHGYDEDEKLLLKVKWLGYPLEECTWEPPHHC